MTSINTIANHPMNLQPSTEQATVGGRDGDGDRGIEPGSTPGRTTGFTQSLQQALYQLNGGSSIVTSNGAQAAIQNFMQQLLAALHQAGTGASQPPDGNGDGVAGASATQASRHGAYQHVTIQGDLQSLIRQVSASSSSSTGLQQSFQGMLRAMGANDGSNTLNGFLQALAANMQGPYLLSTTA